MCFPHSERFAAKLVLFKTRKKFEIPLCYDFWKMFIEKRISQMSLLVSCKSSFIFKILNSSNLIKSRWDEILFCFTLKTREPRTLQQLQLFYSHVNLDISQLPGSFHYFPLHIRMKDGPLFLSKKVLKKDNKSKQSQLHHY